MSQSEKINVSSLKISLEYSAINDIYWIEDADGNTVCDFYYIRQHPVHGERYHRFADAKANGEKIVDLWNAMLG